MSLLKQWWKQSESVTTDRKICLSIYPKIEKKFKWLPHYSDAIRRNFENRAFARMTQLFQDVRKNLPLKPHWMGDAIFKEMKGHWESPAFKIKSGQNKKKS
ncbi:hypothetical protein RDI58_026989 [Solanum bulbocastanum]|uniref:Uncharacterized protein n=1 Tax=Solanum bulbocastanum TaxID=147425 RepID=A0AAN8T1E9_SOLBU